MYKKSILARKNGPKVTHDIHSGERFIEPIANGKNINFKDHVVSSGSDVDNHTLSILPIYYFPHKEHVTEAEDNRCYGPLHNPFTDETTEASVYVTNNGHIAGRVLDASE